MIKITVKHKESKVIVDTDFEHHSYIDFKSYVISVITESVKSIKENN